MKVQSFCMPLERRIGRAQKSAFSLVELLVAMAVIGVLAAILMPAMGGARDGAQMAENVSKLRTLGIASLSYAAENDGQLPVTVQTTLNKPRMTQGPTLGTQHERHVLSLMTQMWDPNTTPGKVWGNTDYLAGPDSFYGPFTPQVKGRKSNSFAPYNSSAIMFLIGYVYYSLPADDNSTPKRGRVHENLTNDQIGGDSLPSTPLFSDITSQTWSDLVGGFTGKVVSCVHMDGSISTHDKDYIWSLGSTNKILALGGVLERN